MPDSPTTNKAMFNLLVDLRGGLPEKCDFCDETFTESVTQFRKKPGHGPAASAKRTG